MPHILCSFPPQPAYAFLAQVPWTLCTLLLACPHSCWPRCGRTTSCTPVHSFRSEKEMDQVIKCGSSEDSRAIALLKSITQVGRAADELCLAQTSSWSGCCHLRRSGSCKHVRPEGQGIKLEHAQSYQHSAAVSKHYPAALSKQVRYFLRLLCPGSMYARDQGYLRLPKYVSSSMQVALAFHSPKLCKWCTQSTASTPCCLLHYLIISSQSI